MKYWKKYYRVNHVTLTVTEVPFEEAFDEGVVFGFLNMANTPDPKYGIDPYHVFVRPEDAEIREEDLE